MRISNSEKANGKTYREERHIETQRQYDSNNSCGRSHEQIHLEKVEHHSPLAPLFILPGCATHWHAGDLSFPPSITPFFSRLPMRAGAKNYGDYGFGRFVCKKLLMAVAPASTRSFSPC
jgi:hypothetical protein